MVMNLFKILDLDIKYLRVNKFRFFSGLRSTRARATQMISLWSLSTPALPLHPRTPTPGRAGEDRFRQTARSQSRDRLPAQTLYYI